jgi:hypothetical protein
VGDYAFLDGFCVQHSTEFPLFCAEPFIETGVENARLHDLRRTGATHLTGEGLSISRFIVSQVLNHISDTGGSSAVAAIYDRNAYLAQKRNALDAWAALLSHIVDNQPFTSNYVTLTINVASHAPPALLTRVETGRCPVCVASPEGLED